jgi:integration host factor subunit beta
LLLDLFGGPLRREFLQSHSYQRFFFRSKFKGNCPGEARNLQLNAIFSRIFGGFPFMLGLEALMGMTKADLVEKVTRLGDLTRRDGEVVVETIFEAVIGALKSGDKIEIRGFGSFRIRQRNPRIGRNPKTGERVEVPAKKVPYFKPSKELRDLVNPGEAA